MEEEEIVWGYYLVENDPVGKKEPYLVYRESIAMALAIELKGIGTVTQLVKGEVLNGK